MLPPLTGQLGPPPGREADGPGTRGALPPRTAPVPCRRGHQDGRLSTRARDFAHSIGKEASNDLTDAEVPAVFARMQLSEASEPRAETQQLTDMVGARHNFWDYRDALRKAHREFFQDAANNMNRSVETIVDDMSDLDTTIAS